MVNPYSAILPILGAAVGTMLLIIIAAYVYTALALMTIAKKTKTKNAWLAWIPIANIYLMTQIAKLPAWLTLIVLLPIIPYIGGIALIAASVYLWWKIAEVRNYPGWIALLMLIPLVNFIIIGIIAWRDNK